jgi:prepilin-type N-terminal cleavage/methylation domain-containing protein
MSLNNIKRLKTERGFTIVELLIVVVIIGILAAIVIVAYNGVTNRAKTSKSQATASSIVKKIEAYNAENGAYAATYAALNSPSTASWYIPAASYNFKAGPNNDVAATDTEITFNFANCATPTGYRIQVWDYTVAAIAKTYGGGATAASTCTNTAT